MAGLIALMDEPHARPSPGWSARAAGGEGWIRTSVRLRGQIYSLLPLTTRPPLQGVHAQTIRGMVEHGQQARHVAAPGVAVNARSCRPSLRSGAPFQAMPPAWLEMERVKGIEPSS